MFISILSCKLVIVTHFVYSNLNYSTFAFQGTTRPTRYHVLRDDIGFSPDELQELVHSLSYVYVQWSSGKIFSSYLASGDHHCILQL
jgi:hypothetical protein